MWVHSVYFWLDKKLGAGERKAFVEALETLRGVESVRGIYIGPPAAATRPAVDRTYDHALTILFEGLKGHEAYQSHPLHKTFVEKFSPYWIKLVVYDHEESR
ncbi:MAG: Dabb family protein [Candidatus Omnitrophota bacterium]